MKRCLVLQHLRAQIEQVIIVYFLNRVLLNILECCCLLLNKFLRRNTSRTFYFDSVNLNFYIPVPLQYTVLLILVYILHLYPDNNLCISMYAAVAGGFRNIFVGCVSLYLVVCVLVYGHKDIYILLKVALNTINHKPKLYIYQNIFHVLLNHYQKSDVQIPNLLLVCTIAGIYHKYLFCQVEVLT